MRKAYPILLFQPELPLPIPRIELIKSPKPSTVKQTASAKGETRKELPI